MAVTVKRWTDASAPTLSGTAGAFIGVLDWALVTGAGWSKVYSGTNKAVYRAPSGKRFYLRVDDTGTTTARVVGYETMSDVDTGTGPFPTDVQVSGGLHFHKSDSANTNARAWRLFANDRVVYFWTNVNNTTGASSNTYGTLSGFGDLIPFNSSDSYSVFIMAGTGSAPSSSVGGLQSSAANTASGHYTARSFTGLGGSVAGGKFSDSPSHSSVMGSTGPAYPHPIDGRMHLAPSRWNEGASGERGYVPGLYGPQHAISTALVGFADTLSGSGALAGKTFEMVQVYSGYAAIETTDWAT